MPTLSMEDAVGMALRRNRQVLAAQLDVDAALVDEVAAKMVPNPSFEFNMGNLVLGRGNPQDIGLRPSFFSQHAASYALQQPIDVWRKRHAHVSVAKQGTRIQRFLLEDAMREVSYMARGRFADVLREQAELELMQETRRGYEQTVQLMRRREAAGDIARADLDKVELEALRYSQLLLVAERELADARQQLAWVLALSSAESLPAQLSAPPLVHGVDDAPSPHEGADLLARALGARPDMHAAHALQMQSVLQASAAARDRLPDVAVGASYTRSHFQISGDNPHALGLQLAVDLPLFSRNQAGMAAAQVAKRQSSNRLAQLIHEVTHEVAQASRSWRMASQALHVYEDGGMLERAQRAREVAKRSFAAGATSLLELLEAERTYLETRADYLRTLDGWRQAHIDVAYATATTPP